MNPFVSKTLLSRWRSALWTRAVGVGTCYLLLNALAATALSAPSDKPTNYPAWWFDQGVIQPKPGTTDNPPLWNNNDYPAPSDYAAANLGQLKWFATKAAAEMNAHLPQGAGAAVNALIASWNAAPGAGVVRADYAALNLGQLKAVAQLFYDQLIAVNYTGAYPWIGGTANDYAIANLEPVMHF